MREPIRRYEGLSLSDSRDYVQLFGRREENKRVFDEWKFWDDVFEKINRGVFSKFDSNDLSAAEQNPENSPKHWGTTTTFHLPNHTSVEYCRGREGEVMVQNWMRGNTDRKPIESVQVSRDGKVDFWTRHLYGADGNSHRYAQTTFTKGFGNKSHILDLDGETPQVDRLLFGEDEVTVQLFRRATSYTGGVSYTLTRGNGKNAVVSKIYFAHPNITLEDHDHVFVNSRTLERCNNPESENSPIDSCGPIGFKEPPFGAIPRGTIYLLAAGEDKVRFYFPELPEEGILFPLELNVEEFLRGYKQRLFDRL